MPITDPDERATRAIVLALNRQSPQLVKFTDNGPTPADFEFTPEDLFDGTFEDIGLTSQVAINGFKLELRDVLPEIADKIPADLSTLVPGSNILDVFNVISLELRSLQVAAKGGGKKGGAKKGTTKNGGTKNAAAGSKKGSKKPNNS